MITEFAVACEIQN